MLNGDRGRPRVLTPGQRSALLGVFGVLLLAGLLAFTWTQVHAAGAGPDAAARAERRLVAVDAVVLTAAVAAVVVRARRVAREAHRRASEEARIRADIHRSRLDSTLQLALEMTASEDHVAFVVERALREASPERPVEWKLADSRTGHLQRVVVSQPDTTWPGCDVGEPEHCAAILRGETRVFASSD